MNACSILAFWCKTDTRIFLMVSLTNYNPEAINLKFSFEVGCIVPLDSAGEENREDSVIFTPKTKGAW